MGIDFTEPRDHHDRAADPEATCDLHLDEVDNARTVAPQGDRDAPTPPAPGVLSLGLPGQLGGPGLGGSADFRPLDGAAGNVESSEAEPSEPDLVGKSDDTEREPEDESIVKPGPAERAWRHGIDAATMDSRELETIRRVGVPDLPHAPLAHRFVHGLVVGGFEAAFWQAAEGAVHFLLPGAGLAVKPAQIIVGLFRAAESLNDGRGMDLVIPVTEIAGGFSADLRLRLCEADPPPLPALRVSIGPTTNESWPNHPALDSASRSAGHLTDSVAPVADMEALTRRWQERAFAVAGRADGIDIHVITFVNPPAWIGRVEIWPSDRPPYCPAWFTLHRNATAPETGRS